MSEECTSSKKIENLVIFILYTSFISIIIFLLFSFLAMYGVISEHDNAISLSSLLSILSSLGVVATLWVYKKEKTESERRSKLLMRTKEKAIKKIYKQELDKTIEIHDEFSKILTYLSDNIKTNDKYKAIIYDIYSSHTINIIDNEGNYKVLIVQKGSSETLNGILLSSTDINETLYGDIFSCLNALVGISHVMSSFFSMAMLMNKDSTVNNKAVCDMEFLKNYFLGEGTNDNSSQLEVVNNGDELKKIALRYK
ncbi:hypothetical protein [Morganella morganii]|uniref:hypothetical protein n=1 Tax=Morganella morganii TaxID=582 RepID=UPI003D059201